MERIQGKKIEKNWVMYLVKWKGFAEASWEPENHLRHGAKQAIKDYELIEQRLQRRPGEYDVEAILAKKKRGGKAKYLVKWKNYPAEESTWESAENLENSEELVQNFEREKNHRKSKKTRK